MGLFNVINRASMAAGAPEDVTQVLANFDALATILNGNIEDVNVKAAAAIALSKLSDPGAGNVVTSVGAGTVAAKPPGYEYVYAEATAVAIVNVTSTNFAAPNTIVTAASVTFDGATSVVIEGYCGDMQPDIAAANRRIGIAIYDNGVALRTFGFSYCQVAGQTILATPYGRHKFTPTAGAHVYSIGAWVTAGTGIIGTGNGGANDVPTWVRVTKA